jgi:hypothetical protein
MKKYLNRYYLIGLLMMFHKRIKRFIRNRQRRLDFIGVGVAKAGTTALHDYLKQHPEIGLGSKKEIHFFDRIENFFFPKWFYFHYHRFFNFKSGKKIYGEITPVYFYWRSAGANIYEYNPKIKIIALLRNPVERAYSQWNMNIKVGFDKHDFEYAALNERERSRRYLPHQHHRYSIIDRGFYSQQIREYRRLFPDEQLLFIKYENFKANPEQTLKTVFHFLDVNPNLFEFQALTSNVFKYEKKMDENLRQQLIKTYENDIHEVERLLGWDCSDWLK